jgi:hypothetical protein
MLALVAFVLSAQAGAKVSAYKPEHKMGELYWGAPSAIDDNLATAWMLPGESENKGEWIDIELPAGTLDKIGMMPGFAKSPQTWTDYPRVKKVKIVVYEIDDERNEKQVGTGEAEFQDKQEWQVVDFPDVKIGAGMFGGKARVTIEDFVPGDDYPNVAISSVLLYMKEMSATPTILSASGEAAGHTKDALKDGNPKTFWAADAAGAQVTFEASGYGISRVGLVPGPAGYAKPKKVQLEMSGRTKVFELPNAPGTQWLEVPATTGYTGSAWGEITLDFLEVWPGTKPELAISDLDVEATSYEGI